MTAGTSFDLARSKIGNDAARAGLNRPRPGGFFIMFLTRTRMRAVNLHHHLSHAGHCFGEWLAACLSQR
jgi:hypothetical protein